mmetsp:Transcript_32222/g.96598  ORF Transcript_32222/g.96598 Transcript_32222/m.96598 type:complete len:281 (+) Transcript_32222:509-1351(+)
MVMKPSSSGPSFAARARLSASSSASSYLAMTALQASRSFDRGRRADSCLWTSMSKPSSGFSAPSSPSPSLSSSLLSLSPSSSPVSFPRSAARASFRSARSDRSRNSLTSSAPNLTATGAGDVVVVPFPMAALRDLIARCICFGDAKATRANLPSSRGSSSAAATTAAPPRRGSANRRDCSSSTPSPAEAVAVERLRRDPLDSSSPPAPPPLRGLRTTVTPSTSPYLSKRARRNSRVRTPGTEGALATKRVAPPFPPPPAWALTKRKVSPRSSGRETRTGR